MTNEQTFAESCLALTEHLLQTSKRKVLIPLESELAKAVHRRFSGVTQRFTHVYRDTTLAAYEAGAMLALSQLAHITEAKRKKELAPWVLPRLPHPKRTAEMAEAQIDWSRLDHSEERAVAIAEHEISIAYHDGMATYAGLWRGGNGPIEKQWSAQPDACANCQGNADMGWIDEEAPFDTGDFVPPQHPNCFLGHTMISATAVSGATVRPYTGEIVILRCAGMAELSVTPNHPILTQHGWLPAGKLQLSDYVVQCINPSKVLNFIDPNDNYVETTIEQITSALSMTGRVSSRTVPVTPEAFHGDVTQNTEVQIVGTNGQFSYNPVWLELLEYFAFRSSELSGVTFSGSSPSDLLDIGMDTATDSSMSGSRQLKTLRFCGSGHSHEHPGASIALLDSSGSETIGDATPGDAKNSTEGENAESGYMQFVKLVDIRKSDFFSGQVYNLETGIGFYLAESIVVHNCRCGLEYRAVSD